MQKEGMSSLSQAMVLLIFFVNTCLLLVIFAPAGHYNPANVYKNVEAQTVAAPVVPPKPQSDLVLEWRLVDTLNDGDWKVEKYREYELQLGDKGQVLKETPTSNYNYIRYWRYR